MKKRILLKPDEKVGLKLARGEPELLLGLILMDDRLAERIRHGPAERSELEMTFDELNGLASYVAAETSYTKDDRCRKKLIRISGRIDRLMARYMVM